METQWGDVKVLTMAGEKVDCSVHQKAVHLVVQLADGWVDQMAALLVGKMVDLSADQLVAWTAH